MNKRSEEIFNDTFDYLISVLVDKATVFNLSRQEGLEGFEDLLQNMISEMKNVFKSVVDDMLKNIFGVPKKREHEYILQAYIITIGLCAFLGLNLEQSENMFGDIDLRKFTTH